MRCSELQAHISELEGAKELFNEAGDDADMREMAREEQRDIEAQLEELDERLKVLLLPRDPNDDKNVMLEIRAGTGGDEAAIWAGDLLKLYTKYAGEQGWSAKLSMAIAALTWRWGSAVILTRLSK